MRIQRLPPTVADANLDRSLPPKTKPKPTPPNNRPTRQQIYSAYDKALAANDQVALAALLDALEQLENLEREIAYQSLNNKETNQ